MELPEGTSLAQTEKVSADLARKIEKIPGVVSIIPASSVRYNRINASFSTILLQGADERGDINEMAGKIRKVLYPEFAYARPRINFPNALGGTDSYAPIRGMLLGPDLKTLAAMAKQINLELLNSAPAVADPRVALNLNSPEVQVSIDRTRASDLGVRVADIASAVRLLMSGE